MAEIDAIRRPRPRSVVGSLQKIDHPVRRRDAASHWPSATGDVVPIERFAGNPAAPVEWERR